MDWELWGTFAVADHLAPRAFVADVLLYDRLVIPVPPNDVERQRWEARGWQPEEQQEILDLLGARAKRVPWTDTRQSEWSRVRDDAEARLHQRGLFGASIADDLHEFNEEPRPDDATPDQLAELAMLGSRVYLADFVDPDNPLGGYKDFFRGLPKVEVDPVVAYGSYDSFKNDYSLQPGRPDNNDLLAAFSWEFLVPEDIRLSDRDLLEQALEVSDDPTIRDSRRAFHQWRREKQDAEFTIEEAQAEMRTMMARYRSANGWKKYKWAIRVGTVLAGIGVAAATMVAGPDVALAGPLVPAAGEGALHVVESRRAARPPGAAMFHDLRERIR